MISGARKVPVLRYFLILTLFAILIAGILFLLLHYRKARGVQYSVEKLMSARDDYEIINDCLITFYNASDNSSLYSATKNNIYIQKFSDDVRHASVELKKLNINDSRLQNPASYITKLKNGKSINDGLRLKNLTDSLLKYAAKLNQRTALIVHKINKPITVTERQVLLDTIKATPQQKAKKRFFGRLFSFLSSNAKESDHPPVIVKRDTFIKRIVNSAPLYKSEIPKQTAQQLLITNRLISEITAYLKLYRDNRGLYVQSSKAALSDNMNDVFYGFRKIAAFCIAFLSVVVIAMLYNFWKIFRNEIEIVEYSEKTTQYALLKSKFLAGMSHEIRTPLNSVIGFSEQLQQEDLPDEQREQVEAIRSSSEMLLELVNEILDFSKYETGKMNFEQAPFMLNQTISEMLQSMQVHATKKRIILENSIAVDDDICCEGDKMRLKQVIMNLLGNAIKFTPKGKVTLTAYVVNKTVDYLTLRVSVKDTGVGIDKNDLPHVFDEFSQVESAQKVTRHKGTGLGLAICKKIIEMQGGNISVESEIGKGSEFSFDLPLKISANESVTETQIFSDELMAELVRDKKVLFVEDNKLNVLLGATILKKWKINHDVAYNGLDALELFKKNNYDVILTDIQMPDMNGLELTGEIRKFPDNFKSRTPIMALTANVMKEDRDIYLNAGMNDVVLKPFLEKNLIEKIALALQNHVSGLRYVS